MTARMSDGRRRGRRGTRLTAVRIAELAGVSAATVSKVLNGRPGVGPQTRHRVEELLREHGYRLAGRGAPSASVEVVFYALESHLAIEIMRGVRQVAQERRLVTGFAEVPDGGLSPEHSWADDLLARSPSGVIVVYSRDLPDQHDQLVDSGVPLVALDPRGDPLDAIPSVGATNWNGGIAATRHLLGLGHQRIGVISGPLGYMCARARLEACRAAMDEAGTPLDQRLLRTGGFTYEEGFRLGRELLSLPEPPTAIVCGNDLQALGLYEAARQFGRQIPRDLSVVGFDDVQYARWCGPPLTTVRQPFAEMGATATRLVLELAAGERPTQTRIELVTTLVVRQSTAAPGQSPSGQD